MNATDSLKDALEEEDLERAAEAIRLGADVNALWDDQVLLSGAVQIANVELLRLLLSAGADPNRKNPDGTTALTWCGTAEITAILLDAGASARHELGRKVEFASLHNAAGDGDVARLRLLLERGEGGCLLDTFTAGLRWTPLHHAADEGHCEAAQLLIDAGADANRFDEELLGFTAIKLATYNNHLEMVKLLLAHGADPTLQVGLNSSALDDARRRPDNPALLECIEEAIRQRRGSTRS